MIGIGEAVHLERWMRALTGLDGPVFLALGKRLARVLAEQVADRPPVPPDLLHLFCVQAYPTQDVMGYLFGLSRPQTCSCALPNYRLGQKADAQNK